MSKLSLNFTVDMGNTSVAAQIIDESVMPLLYQAVRAIGQQLQMSWAEGVYAAKLWSDEKDEYAKSIQIREDGPLKLTVYSDYKYAEDIENGRPARDLKKMLTTSRKTRSGKGGSVYLIIPFRHNTPGYSAHAAPMPIDVYKMAKDMAPSQITALTTRKSASGHTVPQRVYKWGGRLAAGMAPKAQSHHKTDLYAGMVRMETSAGGGKSSSYLTFRVMSSKSKGWIVPPQPGQKIAETAVNELRPKAEAAVQEAVRLTFKKK